MANNGIGKDVQKEINDIKDAITKLDKIIKAVENNNLEKLPDEISAVIGDGKDAVEEAVKIFYEGKDLFDYFEGEALDIYHELFG